MDKREEVALLMEEFENSGQTQKEFSTSRGMAFPNFNYWFRKLNKKKEETGGLVRRTPAPRPPVPENSWNWFTPTV